MKKVVRLTESDLIKIVKRVINEQSSLIKGSVFKKITKPDWTEEKDGDGGFAVSRVSDDTNVTSILNKYSGGEVQSKKNSLNEFDPKTSNTYGAVYWIKGKPNEKFSITINGDNVSYKIDVTIETEMWTGYAFYFTNIPVGTYTIQATNDNINRLTITIVEPANCEEEWKTLYENMEDDADDGSIDLRLYYCSKDHTNYIKGEFPNIDVAKVSCLLRKVKQTYCK